MFQENSTPHNALLYTERHYLLWSSCMSSRPFSAATANNGGSDAEKQ